jgi:hypothetical protein
VIQKPKNWNNMAFYQKIAHYGRFLTREHSIYVDKLRAKEIVKEMCKDCIYPIHVPRVVRVIENIEDIRESDLNENYLIKGSHGCKYNINIDKHTTIDSVKKQLKSFNQIFNPYHSEKQYTFLQPKFFIEEKINDFYTGVSGKAGVFMIRCIYGKPISIGIIIGNKMNNYDIEWNPINLEIPSRIFNAEEIKEEVSKMIELSKILSSPFEFVRLDFYLDQHRDIYFSEFTLTPSGGKMVYPNHKIEYELGKSWV